MKKKKTLLIILALFIFNFITTYFVVANNDLIWNYGFCYNYAKGLKLYSDFNMVITPLYPFIIGNLMKLIGINIITFYLINAIIPTLLELLIYKYYKKSFIPSIILITFINSPNYNLACLFLLFILFILEDKYKNDYIIGLILGMAFLTKTSMIILTLSSLYYYKDIKKIIKRFIGFIIPNILFIIYFYINNSLYDYYNYVFLSLFDFASKNFRFYFGIIIFLISLIYLIYKFYKKKDIKILYIILFQIMSYPIFNMIHIIYSFIPVGFYIFYCTNNKTYKKYNKFLLIILLCPIMSTVLQNTILDMKDGTGALKYKKVQSEYVDDAMIIKDNIPDLDKAYFVMYESYYNKLLLNLPINKYDLLLNGNIGYNGAKNTINYFNSLKMSTIFIVYREYEGGQFNEEIYNYIVNNYKLKSSFDKYEVYIK